ncbi:hypothetical protein AAF712_004315 [Marasmius tenuissimus]|uniref:Uncharacterized protein n=1 Tax=Marasmius tenuissimus TaxID=585030 RepID=A0ABR3A524_9AGAR
MSLNEPLTTSNDKKPSSSLISIVAIGVLWLFPSALGEPKSPTADDLQRITRQKRESRRKSAPPALSSSRSKSYQGSPAANPVIIVPVVVAPTGDSPPSSSSRRVYFLEPQTKPRSSRRYSAPAEEHLAVDCRTPILQIPEDVSPRSSSSTLVQVSSTSSHHTAILDTCEEVIESADSDTSSKRSDSRSKQSRFLLGRFKGRWARRPSTSPETSAAPAEDPPPILTKPSRRTSLGISPPWLITKPRTTIDLSTPPPASPVEPPSRPQTPTMSEALFSRPSRKVSASEKANRRSSLPQRTQPYAYPYFAEPPSAPGQRSSIDSPAEYLTAEERGRREVRERNARVQASLGLGQRPPTRRSTSAVA